MSMMPPKKGVVRPSAENFPFRTIDPNESRVPVPDERLDFLGQYHKPASKIPAFLNVVDIAGLVKGAHNGQGLGNTFLSHISACDGIFHLTRAFEDDDITHVEGSVDPIRDIEIIHEELQLKDEEMIGPIIDKLEKVAVRGGDKKLKPEYDIIGALELKLQELSAEGRQKYLEANTTQSASPKIIKAGLAALQREYFLTAGLDDGYREY
ncbi:hypothetical protein MC885_016447 [Smutsia gigantea]|nr:hypothetical protein MC885_016447 [Smutsia gigantea]